MIIKKYELKNDFLKKYIKYIWLFEADNIKISNYLLPVNNIDLIINFNSSIIYKINNKKIIVKNKPFFLGPFDKSVFIEQMGNIKVMGISFKTFGFHSLIDKPIYNFFNKLVYLDDVSENLTNRLFKDLDKSIKGEELVRIIESNLIKVLNNKLIDKYHNEIINQFLNDGFKDKIQNFSSEMNISSRQLLRVFKRYSGFSTKKISKITRFQNISRELLNSKNYNFSSLAIKYGYYDQMHFIKDCKELTGHPPLQFKKSKLFIKSIVKK